MLALDMLNWMMASVGRMTELGNGRQEEPLGGQEEPLGGQEELLGGRRNL